jgi:hypothetical protein
MKDNFLSLLWAAICAGLATWYIVEQDAKYGFLSAHGTEYGFLSEYVLPTVNEILQKYEIPMPAFIFTFLLLLLLLTGLHKLIGNGIRLALGVAGFITLVCLAVIGALIVLSMLMKLF